MGKNHPGEKGTSPRTRGKRLVLNPVPVILRNIPAYAGKTLVWLRSQLGEQEHPRVRGENSTPHGYVPILGGTSPRTRGKHPYPDGTAHRFRNIPAYAGKTRGSAGGSILGEGTSPRTRGKLSLFAFLASSLRNIPAYAGKTL